MARIYLETSFVSACVTDRTDSASLYRRQESLAWWNSERDRHELRISSEVIKELNVGSFRRRVEALTLIEAILVLDQSPKVTEFARLLVMEKVMPGPDTGDALHVAYATIHKIDAILSWNVRHLANLNKVAHLRTVCLRAGYQPPRILTPDFLWENPDDRPSELDPEW